MSGVRLWEVKHPYYCSESNYYVGGEPNKFFSHNGMRIPKLPGWDDGFAPFNHVKVDSWAAFELKDSDPDLNLVFRWDWSVPDPDDYGAGESMPGERLLLFVMQQRKGKFLSYSMPVARDEEPEIRAWLVERAKTITALWAPLDLSAPASPEEGRADGC